MKLVLVLLLAASLGLTGCSSLEITDVEGKKYVPNEYELTIYCYRQGYNGEEIPVGGLDVGLFHRREDFAPFRSGTTDWNGIYTTKVTAESRLYIGVWKDGIRVHRPCTLVHT